MASKSPKSRLLHIQRELEWMLGLLETISYEEFVGSIIHTRAVEHGFLIISEAVRTLPRELIDLRPEIDWAAIRALGNVLRHEYQLIEPQRLWSFMEDYLPTLHIAVAHLLDQVQD